MSNVNPNERKIQFNSLIIISFWCFWIGFWISYSLYDWMHEAQQNHKLCLLLSFDIFHMKKQSDSELKRNEGTAKTMDEKSAAMCMLCAAANLIMACENTQIVRVPVCVAAIFMKLYVYLWHLYFGRCFVVHENDTLTQKKRDEQIALPWLCFCGVENENKRKTWPSFNTLDVLWQRMKKICSWKNAKNGNFLKHQDN